MNFQDLKLKLNNINLNQIWRMVLYIAVALVGVALWDAWNKDHPSTPAETRTNSQTVQSPATNSFVPPSYSTSSGQTPLPPSSQAAAASAAPTSQGIVNVKTDVLDVNINSEGNLIDAKLLKYDESLEKPRQPMPILEADQDALYIAQSGLKALNASELESIHFQADQPEFVLGEGQDNLAVKLTGTTASGLQVIKTFIFEKNKYNIQVNYQLHNKGNTLWQGNIYQQIVRKNVPPKGSQHSRSYNGAAISTPGKPYEKVPFKKLNETQINQNVQGGWIAMQQPYFLTAWIPPAHQMNHFYSSAGNNTYTLGYVGAPLSLAPGTEMTQSAMFYAGPELPNNLKDLGKGLDLTIDYGWLWMFSVAIFWVMDHIHTIVGNWGWSIILTTLLIKLIFYKLSEKSYTSMAKMRAIQPRLQALKDRYGDDKAALSKATMEFYKKEKINPIGGCLPTIIQIPVFIALYYVLIESVQLRQAPFILWIRDLSVHDPFYVLPILMGISMFIQQKLSPPPPDPTQAKMMMLLPVIFTVFFLSFPAGLVLYWLVNNCASILQQWYIMKTYHQKKSNKVSKDKRKNKK